DIKISGKNILPMSKLPALVDRLKINIGIITVPKQYAQEICNIMVKSGIRGIWNFAPIHLEVPADIVVKNENMAASLAYLSRKLSETIN
ncbi:MAG: redox-sensing transcriptional repressor Rex, partial [Bacteroidales bacterium]